MSASPNIPAVEARVAKIAQPWKSPRNEEIASSVPFIKGKLANWTNREGFHEEEIPHVPQDAKKGQIFIFRTKLFLPLTLARNRGENIP